MILRSTDVRGALRSRQRGFLLNPFRFGAGGGGGDPSFAAVSLLLHGDGANNSPTVTDSSSHGFTVTVNGDAKLTTSGPQFGTASINFDGTGDYLTLSSDAAFSYGTGDLTQELWVYAAASAVQGLVGHGDGAGPRPYLYLNGLTPTFFFNLTNVATGPALSLNTWTHVAAVRNSGSLKIYTAGVGGTPVADLTNLSNTGLWIGGSSIGTQFFTGKLDELRITKGVARYTSNFTPPSAAFPDS